MKSLSDEFYHEIDIKPERELKVQKFYCSPGFEINSSDDQTATAVLYSIEIEMNGFSQESADLCFILEGLETPPSCGRVKISSKFELSSNDAFPDRAGLSFTILPAQEADD